MEITLEKIELVKDRTGVTYKEAKEALEAADGSVVDAIINIEESVNSEEHSREKESAGNELFETIKKTAEKGNMARIIVRKGGDILLNLPLTVSILGAVIAPWGVIFGLIAAVGFNCKIEFINDRGEITDINGKVKSQYGKVKEKSAEFGEKSSETFDKIKDSDLYNRGSEAVDRIRESDIYNDLREKRNDALNDLRDKGTEAFNDLRDKGADAFDDLREKRADIFKKKEDAGEDDEAYEVPVTDASEPAAADDEADSTEDEVSRVLEEVENESGLTED
jgi:hypothetical protein